MNGVISLNDSAYPGLLKEIRDAPKKLYYKGNWDGFFSAQGGSASGGEYCLAVVGTRQMTSYGRRVTEQLVGEIAAAGVTIVSGFMYGVDATAHKAALRVGGKTIAVMPCGIDIIHPNYQKDLYNEILSPYGRSPEGGETNGLIVSEFEGAFLPTLWSYPKRNRIVAGLSQATMVVEAGEKSGSLITAHLAKKYGRKVFAVPGPLTSSVSVGIMQLIKEGASVVTSAKDILDFYGIKSEIRSTKSETSSKSKIPNTLEEKILEQLRAEPKEVDELARILDMPVSQLGTTLSLMQLSGVVLEEGGRYYVQ